MAEGNKNWNGLWIEIHLIGFPGFIPVDLGQDYLIRIGSLLYHHKENHSNVTCLDELFFLSEVIYVILTDLWWFNIMIPFDVILSGIIFIFAIYPKELNVDNLYREFEDIMR